MSLQPVLINGVWRQSLSPMGSFSPVNPANKISLTDHFPISNFEEAETALQAGKKAACALRSCSPEAVADFLENFARMIEERSHELVGLAHLETALPKEPRLRSVELPRTTHQLQQAAAAVRDRSWCRAVIDTKAGIRSKYGPLGCPVIVFGPNNFPFAFNSAAGGDFAAAIAAGNPVLAKANPGHPGTTKIFTELAFKTLQQSGLPPATVQLIYHLQPEDGLKLVSHPLVGATAFTGSRPSGLRLKEAADRAGKLIYLEMSSVNPIFILLGALKERREEIAGELLSSCTLGSGQFCTKPGLVILEQGAESEKFLLVLQRLFEQMPAGVLLGQRVLDGIESAVDVMKKYGAQVAAGGRAIDGPGYRFANTLLRLSGDQFLEHPEELEQEAFGATSLLVFSRNFQQMLDIAEVLKGNLTGSIYSHRQGEDDNLYLWLESILRQKVGRLLNDKMPTGVAVSPAMVHGGPFPATGHPGFTSVGIPSSLLRFAALHCYDNVRPHRLPPELGDKNPTGRMWRMIDGEWTQQDVR
ncbi:MAG: aldehyde dehydrogenase (NADP(+)) [Candidatus Aminicenantales bacterium]